MAIRCFRNSKNSVTRSGTEYGHGLWLIRQVADQASVRSGPGGTVAVVSFALGPPGRLPPFRLARQARDGCTILAAAGRWTWDQPGSSAARSPGWPRRSPRCGWSWTCPA